MSRGRTASLIDAFEVRMALETFAMERAVRNLTKANRDELRKACETMHAMAVSLRTRRRPLLEGRPLVVLTADLSFHLLLLKAAGNHLAIKIVTNVYQRNLFFGQYSHRSATCATLPGRGVSMPRSSVRYGAATRALRLAGCTRTFLSMADALTAFDAATAAATPGGRAPAIRYMTRSRRSRPASRDSSYHVFHG